MPEEHFWHIQGRLVDQCVSPDHVMYYINQDGKHMRQVASEFVPRLLKAKKGSKLSLPVAFKYDGPGFDLTDVEIKIMLAVICDGSFQRTTTDLCRFHIKKDRKKEKLRELEEDGFITRKQFNAEGAPIYKDFGKKDTTQKMDEKPQTAAPANAPAR